VPPQRAVWVPSGLRHRARHRIIEAIHRLAAGDPVTRVSAEIGYATPSAFTAAFRRELGTTPTRYLTSPR
jgi:AraC-like DNA-binding protein